MRRCLLVGVLFLLHAPTAYGAWSYSRSITTAHAQAGSTDSTNFPVTVILSNGGVGYNVGTTLKVTGSGGHIQHTVTQSGGAGGTEPADLVFGTTNTCTTLLPWETDFYDGTAGTLTAHVSLSTLSHTSDNVFYVCYGDASVTTQQNTGSYSPANVWDSNFKGVYHLSNGTTLSAVDSTSNANNGTINGTVTAVSGQVDGGAAFATSTANNITSGVNQNGQSKITVSTWFKRNSTGGVVYVGESGSYDFQIGVYSDGSIYAFVASGYGTVASNDTSWHHAVLVFDGTQTGNSNRLKFYLDGSSQTISFASSIGASMGGGTTMKFGGTAYTPNGSLDELRFSTTIARSADWITAEYNNQKPSSNFLTIGAESGGSVAYNSVGLDVFRSFDVALSLGSHFVTGLDYSRNQTTVSTLAAHFQTVLDYQTIQHFQSTLAAHFPTAYDYQQTYGIVAAIGNHFPTAYDYTQMYSAVSTLGTHFQSSYEYSAVVSLVSVIGGYHAVSYDSQGGFDTAVPFGAHRVSPYDYAQTLGFVAVLGTHYMSTFDIQTQFVVNSSIASHFVTHTSFTLPYDLAAKLGGRAVFGLEYSGSFDTSDRLLASTRAGVDTIGTGDYGARLLSTGRLVADWSLSYDLMGRGLSASVFESGGLMSTVSTRAGRMVSGFEVLPYTDVADRRASHTVLYSDGSILLDITAGHASHNITVSDVLANIDIATRLGHSSFIVTTTDRTIAADISSAVKYVYAPILSSGHVLIYQIPVTVVTYKPQVTVVVVK